MSNYHAFADECHAAAPTGSEVLGEIIGALRRATVAAVLPLRQALERRATAERVGGLPAHLLADFGYERDWDGSVHPLPGDDA